MTTNPAAPRHPASRALRRPLAVALAASLALTAAACGDDEDATDSGATTTVPTDVGAGDGFHGPADDAGPPVTGGGLVMGLESELEHPDPLRGSYAASGYYVGTAIYDPLATVDADGEVVPFLAESIEPNDTFTEWTITVRPDVTFHDGTALDAEALKANLDAQKTSLIGAPFLTSLESTEVTGERSVLVRTTQPWTSFPYTLTTQVGFPVAPSTIGGTADPSGTGPFRFVEWERNDHLSVERNDDYWRTDENGTQLPYVNSIEFRPIPDSKLRLTQLEAGDLDLMVTYLNGSFAELRAGEWKRVEESQGEEDLISLNTTVAPFDQLIARQALAMATDGPGRLEQLGQDPSELATSPFSDGEPGHRVDDGYPEFDPDGARALVEQYEAEFGPFTFTYQGATNVDDVSEQNILVEGWRAVGMDVSVETVDQPTLILNTVTGNYQATDWRNFGHLDPDAEYVWWHSSTIDPAGISTNVARYADPAIDAALDEARGTADPAVRDEAFARVVAGLNAGVPYIWLDHVRWIIAARPGVNGLPAAANGTVATLNAKTWLAELWVTQ